MTHLIVTQKNLFPKPLNHSFSRPYFRNNKAPMLSLQYTILWWKARLHLHQKFQGQFPLYSEFEASLGYLRLCLKKQTSAMIIAVHHCMFETCHRPKHCRWNPEIKSHEYSPLLSPSLNDSISSLPLPLLNTIKKQYPSPGPAWFH